MTSELDNLSEAELKTLIETYKHIKLVSDLLGSFVVIIQERMTYHDSTKLEKLELEGFSKTIQDLETLTYGSPEYKEYLHDKLQPVLDHHYKHNSHHPEHFENGISDMTLIDVVEMFFDWLAATYRHADGDIISSIHRNVERFDLSPQLEMIFLNTVKYYGTEGVIVIQEEASKNE